MHLDYLKPADFFGECFWEYYRMFYFESIQVYSTVLSKYKRIMRVDEANLLFIRHAESQGNLSTDRYITQHNMPYDWDYLSKDHKYLAQVKYNYDLLDCDITEKGYEDCRQARKKLELYQPDVILVSPLNRTLKTCSEVFPEATCPVIVQPILAEGLRSAADYSGPLTDKKVNYPQYNFDQVEQAGEFWFIKNDSEENQAKYQAIIATTQHKGYPETIKALLAYMLQTWVYETPTNLRLRTNKLKLLLKNYSQQYRRIAVVSHYNIIRFVLAESFNERDEPQHCHIANCEIRTAAIDQM